MFCPSLNCYFIFADVTLTESSLYFKSLSSPPVSPSKPVHITVLVLFSVPTNPSPPPNLQVYRHC